MESWEGQLGLPVEIRQDTRFICSHAAFRDWANGRQQLRMEYFYRRMREATGLLMEGDTPVGGRWNFDAENRKPAKADLGAYIDRMSYYCRGCTFDVKAKADATACPCNFLYWDFLARNRTALEGNPRIAPMYRTLDKMSEERRTEIAADASRFLSTLES